MNKKIDHYEDCAQLFESIGRMHVVEAALTFFDMETLDDEPKMNSISDAFMSSDVEKKCIFENMMKKFVEEFALASDNRTHECDDQISSSEQLDRIKAYALNYLKHFLLFEDLNDAVKEGDGPRLATLSKVLLLHFKAVHGFNSYAIEMITNIAQNSVLLSECLSNQCIWAATASWKGGIRKKTWKLIYCKKIRIVTKKPGAEHGSK